MSTTPVQFTAPPGLTLTLELYADGSDTLANSPADSCTEAANRDGFYTASVTEALAGEYLAVVKVGGTALLHGWATMADTTTPVILRSERVNTQTAVAAAIAAADLPTDDDIATRLLVNPAIKLANSSTLLSRVYAAVRNVGDTQAIDFPWPVDGATVSGTVSINNATATSITGAFSQLADRTGTYWYRLAYNSADRPTGAGSAVYQLTDGSNTRTLALRMDGVLAEDIAALNDISTSEMQTAAAAAITAANLLTADDLTVTSYSVERPISDESPIVFPWPVDSATVTGARSINQGEPASVSGAITQLNDVGSEYRYQLAYNAADRPSTAGQSVTYTFTDGTNTRYVTLRVSVAEAAGLTDEQAERLRLASIRGVAPRNMGTLQAGATAGTITLAVEDSGDFQVGELIQIGEEVMFVTGGQGGQLAVTRGQAGTTASSHDSGAVIYSVAASSSASETRAGDVEIPILIKTPGEVPVSGVAVWFTSDADGLNVVEGTLYTDINGYVRPFLTDGDTYYLWATQDGKQTIRGQQFTAQAS